jgi:hypothetical protein
MPLTFPAHAAAILPLLHLPGTRRLPAAALLVGSTTPDLIYLTGLSGKETHLCGGLLSFCLPAGLLAFLYLEGLLLPALAPWLVALLPRPRQKKAAWLLAPRPLPCTLAGWLAVGLALLLGAGTHLLWDGFTHGWMWPARVLYPGVTVVLLGHSMFVSRLLQHLCSLFGSALVLLYVALVKPGRLPSGAPSASLYPPRRDAATKLLRLVLLPLLGGGLAGALRLRNLDPHFTQAVWDVGWAALAWFLLLLGFVCLWVRVGRRAAPA